MELDVNVLSSRLGLSPIVVSGDGIEILDAKRKNLKLALITDTGFIDTGWWVPFHPAYYLPPP